MKYCDENQNWMSALQLLKIVPNFSETKQYTTWSDAAFCGVWSGSAVFAYELLQTFRQLITYADSLDPEQAQLVRIVLSSKRNIIHEKKWIFGVHLILIYDV